MAIHSSVEASKTMLLSSLIDEATQTQGLMGNKIYQGAERDTNRMFIFVKKYQQKADGSLFARNFVLCMLCLAVCCFALLCFLLCFALHLCFALQGFACCAWLCFVEASNTLLFSWLVDKAAPNSCFDGQQNLLMRPARQQMGVLSLSRAI